MQCRLHVGCEIITYFIGTLLYQNGYFQRLTCTLCDSWCGLSCYCPSCCFPVTCLGPAAVLSQFVSSHTDPQVAITRLTVAGLCRAVVQHNLELNWMAEIESFCDFGSVVFYVLGSFWFHSIVTYLVLANCCQSFLMHFTEVQLSSNLLVFVHHWLQWLIDFGKSKKFPLSPSPPVQVTYAGGVPWGNKHVMPKGLISAHWMRFNELCWQC